MTPAGRMRLHQPSLPLASDNVEIRTLPKVRRTLFGNWRCDVCWEEGADPQRSAGSFRRAGALTPEPAASRRRAPSLAAYSSRLGLCLDLPDLDGQVCVAPFGEAVLESARGEAMAA